MTSEWASGYVTDLGYTHGFYRELTPAILNFAALAKGFETCFPPSGGISYCELGCGQGFSANLLAAANPNMEVYATDFNPEQISGARRLANTAGLTNIHFFDNSFAEFQARNDLPEFDVIVLHGIYSWIAKEHRDTIIKFINTRLKPGGLVYISYNCLPGWAGAAPLRQLMHIQVNDSPGTISTKLDSTFSFIDQLESLGARYFKAIPNIKSRFEKIKGMNRNYLAHEYLNANWTLFYHSDVAAELSEARLSYIGSAHLIDHIDSINLTVDQRRLLEETASVTKRELLRDYIVNQQFRRDIFARGAIPLSVGEARESWLESHFILTTPPKEIPLKVNGVLGEANLEESTYKPLIEAFAMTSVPISLRQILQDRTIANLGWNRLQQAIIILVGAGHLQPCLNSPKESRRNKITKSFNQAVIERAQYSNELRHLASPVTGGAITVDRFQQLFLLATSKKEDPITFVWNTLKAQNQRISKNGETLKTEDENITEIKSNYNLFKDRLATLKSIDVI